MMKAKELNQIKNVNEQCTRSIIIAGYDGLNLLDAKPNNQNEDCTPIIYHPLKFPFDPSSLLCFSSYFRHSLLITTEGSLKSIGKNLIRFFHYVKEIPKK